MARITFDLDSEVNEAFRIRLVRESDNISNAMRQLCQQYAKFGPVDVGELLSKIRQYACGVSYHESGEQEIDSEA